jgi:hypothetical protein
MQRSSAMRRSIDSGVSSLNLLGFCLCGQRPISSLNEALSRIRNEELAEIHRRRRHASPAYRLVDRVFFGDWRVCSLSQSAARPSTPSVTGVI